MSRLIRTLDHLPAELHGAGVAIGNFDAVHLGHAALARTLIELAQAKSKPAIIFTFDPPPGAILFPDRFRTKPLTTMARRAELFGKLGASALLAYPTTREFLTLTARQFFDQVIVDRLGASILVEGPNFRFGHGRHGDMFTLREWSRAVDIQVAEVSLLESGSQVVSSTRVRELVSSGVISQANEILMEPYRLEGEVVTGAQRGRTIGFPTANLSSIEVLLPAPGVYAGRVLSLSQTPIPAAIHIGPNPTFAEDQSKVEVHMLDWQGNVYGQRLVVELLQEVRGIARFPSVEALQTQLALDVAQCRQIAVDAATHDG